MLTGNALVAVLRAVGSAFYEPDDQERVSTWSIRKQDARVFFLLLYGWWFAAVAVLAYAQYAANPLRMIEWATPSPHVGDGTAYAVIQRFGAVVVPLMVIALMLTPILIKAGRILMSLAQFINDKILDPLIDAKIVAPNAERISERVSERVTAQVTEQVTERVTTQVTERVTAQVTARTNEQWVGWLARRDAALAQGLEFNEPRPDEADIAPR